MTGGQDFWSRRKAAVEAETEAETRAAEARAVEAELAEREEMSDAEILAELELPDPDDLRPGDDIRGFMSKAVPERLKRRALRRLWTLNPMLANLDGMVDYGDDFTDAAVVLPDLKTAYQVGKGMLAHIEALAARAEADESPIPADASEPPAAEAVVAETERPHDAETETAGPIADPAPDPDTELATDTDAPAPRRMRFAFEDQT